MQPAVPPPESPMPRWMERLFFRAALLGLVLGVLLITWHLLGHGSGEAYWISGAFGVFLAAVLAAAAQTSRAKRTAHPGLTQLTEKDLRELAQEEDSFAWHRALLRKTRVPRSLVLFYRSLSLAALAAAAGFLAVLLLRPELPRDLFFFVLFFGLIGLIGLGYHHGANRVYKEQQAAAETSDLPVPGPRSGTEETDPPRPPATTVDRLALATALIAAFMPLVGVLFLGWSLGVVMILVWVEFVLLGLSRSGTLLLRRERAAFRSLAPLSFLVMPIYGLTIFGMFVVPPEISDGNVAVHYVADAFREAFPAIGVLLLSMAVAFWRDARHTEGQHLVHPDNVVQRFMWQIAILHVALLGGAIGIQELGNPFLALVALVALKAVYDVLRSVRTLDSGEPSAGPTAEETDLRTAAR